MVLVTGPTGSGKTNTLYSALQRINTPEVNIITAEDPVEINLAGINQVQMKEQIGLNFAASVHLVVAQRLVRRICSYCKEPIEQPPAALTNAGFKETEARHIRLFRGR